MPPILSIAPPSQLDRGDSKAAELTEFPVLTFAFCTVVIEWQEHGANDWHTSERGGNMLYSLSLSLERNS